MTLEDPVKIVINAYLTAWGWIGTVGSSKGLLGTTLPVASRDRALAHLVCKWPSAEEGMLPCFAALYEKLCRYFRGEAVDFRDEVLDTDAATDFRIRVWETARAIPYGQVRSYSWVASQIGVPQGSRAVGQVMANNPFPIVVPCHRVVGRDGHLTGFAAGLEMKRRLLELEAVKVNAHRVILPIAHG